MQHTSFVIWGHHWISVAVGFHSCKIKKNSTYVLEFLQWENGSTQQRFIKYLVCAWHFKIVRICSKTDNIMHVSCLGKLPGIYHSLKVPRERWPASHEPYHLPSPLSHMRTHRSMRVHMTYILSHQKTNQQSLGCAGSTLALMTTNGRDWNICSMDRRKQSGSKWDASSHEGDSNRI